MPAQKRVIGLSFMPHTSYILQVIFHVDLSRRLLEIGAVVGAMYGGHIMMTVGIHFCHHMTRSSLPGRMSYSKEDPCHVTWFLDAMGCD